jgi:hypothetical protein
MISLIIIVILSAACYSILASSLTEELCPVSFSSTALQFTSNTGHSSTSGRIFFVAAFCKLVHAVTAPEIGSPHLSVVTPVESLLQF